MKLLEAAHDAAAHVTSWPRDAIVRIVAHHDVDGVASAAIALSWLQRAGRRFHVTYTWRHDLESLARIEKNPEDPVLLVDLGAAHAPHLGRVSSKGLLIDHHPPAGGDVPDGWMTLNPWHHGLDGARHASAATTTFAAAEAQDAANADLAPIALTGAIADRQDLNDPKGLNHTILHAAYASKHAAPAPILNLPDDPLIDLLEFPPAALRGVTSKAEAGAWIDALGLPRNATVHELTASDRQLLASALVLGRLDASAGLDTLHELTLTGPTSPKHKKTPLVRLASLADAAIRQDEPGLALSMLMGDDGARREVEGLETKFNTMRRELANDLQASHQERPGFRHAQVHGPAMTAVVSGWSIGRVVADDKPLIVWSTTEKDAILSARATTRLVQSGIDLGSTLAQLAQELGGQGGGHAVAAGATIPKGRLAEAWTRLDALLAPTKEASR